MLCSRAIIETAEIREVCRDHISASAHPRRSTINTRQQNRTITDAASLPAFNLGTIQGRSHDDFIGRFHGPEFASKSMAAAREIRGIVRGFTASETENAAISITLRGQIVRSLPVSSQQNQWPTETG